MEMIVKVIIFCLCLRFILSTINTLVERSDEREERNLGAVLPVEFAQVKAYQ